METIKKTIPVIQKAQADAFAAAQLSAPASSQPSQPSASQTAPTPQNSDEMRLRKIGLGPGSEFRLYDKCLKKCTDIISHPALWKARGELYEIIGDYDHAIEFRKSHVQGLQLQGWEESVESALDVLKAVKSLVSCYLTSGTGPYLTSAKLLVDGTVTRIRQSDSLADEKGIQKLVDELESYVKTSGGNATHETTVEPKVEAPKKESTIPAYLSDWA